jgi:hypothetical protein|mmetsp:Transcript_101425/g.160373  ORF Transcript_101425/g.160373 Transcript_101425/m.160373 type:complete len:196 (+) Transcript_101425:84-671(+)
MAVAAHSSLVNYGSPHLPVIVKNTFIHMKDDSVKVDPRRCTSAPPRCRHQCRPEQLKEFVCINKFSDDSSSTACGSPRGSSMNCSAMDERSNQGSECGDTWLLNPNAPAYNPLLFPGALASAVLAEPLLAFFQMPQAPPNQCFAECETSPPPQHDAQHCFNRNAAAWTPSNCTRALYLDRDSIAPSLTQPRALPR